MARSEFHDVVATNAGAPINGASVTVYTVDANGNQGGMATIYLSETGSAKANPFTTGADGFIDFWADSNARYNVVITAAGFAGRTVRFEAGWTSTASQTSSGHFIGEVIDWPGLTLPSFGSEVWAWADGSALDRTTYANLRLAITSIQNGTRSSGQPQITGLTSTAGMAPGMLMEGTGLQAGSKILTVDSSSQVTMDRNASSSGTSSITFFPFGNGDGSTTFNIVDHRGRNSLGLAISGGHPDVAGMGLNDGLAASLRRGKHRHTNGSALSGSPGIGGAPGVGTLALPPHVHAYTDPGHQHVVTQQVDGGTTGWKNAGDTGNGTVNKLDAVATTGIVMGNPTTTPAISGAPSLGSLAGTIGSLSVSGLIGNSSNDNLDAAPYVVIGKAIRLQ